MEHPLARFLVVTPRSARVPGLIPAAGSPEAARSWVVYEQVCKQREHAKPEISESDRASDNVGPSPSVEQDSTDSMVSTLCKELNIGPPDPQGESFVSA